ncbi:MAG: lamin tail domain-containing protein [Candidatus Saccharibacteria bacterium]|nr:lamin tail domain-containing protein [Candidatus Saccharibacteria bacterium]
MHKLYVVGLLFFSLLLTLVLMQPAHAISPNIVISQLQLGSVASASNEFIELYNNSTSDSEVTNWCLYYASAGSTQIGNKMTCFTPDNENTHLYIPGRTFSFAISNQLSIYQTSLGSDFKFSAALSGTAGHVRLIDSGGLEVDKIGWGSTAVSAEGLKPAVVPATGKVLSRKIIAGNLLQDTDINSDDIEAIFPKTSYSYGSIYEVQDVCINISGIQTSIPIGYTVDATDNCIPPPVDICPNLDGLQTAVPDQYWQDVKGNCQKDSCLNITGVQQKLPDGMKYSDDGLLCILDLLPLQITELLPNPIGSDEGNEFIEIYNPNSSSVNLSEYKLMVGVSAEKYNFPAGSIINPNQYMSFSNDDIKFTLVNTTSSVKLVSSDDQQVYESSTYFSPEDGSAWSLIDGSWQYTNQPTPNEVNRVSLIEPGSGAIEPDGLMPCAANQYRSPETNRCRLFVTSVSTLAACKDGQYRSEETNRCRSIASDVGQLMPCAEGQERNPATNRCRSVSAVLGANNLTPCKAGQERNAETNRCRNIVGTIPSAGYAPEQANESSNNSILMWSLISVGAIAICYGIWEWRQEIVNALKKVKFGFNNK